MSKDKQEDVSWIGENDFLEKYPIDPDNTKEGTHYRYSKYLKLFATWLVKNFPEYEDDDLPLSPNKLTTKMVVDYFKWLRDDHKESPAKSASTIRTYAAGVNGYLTNLWLDEMLPTAVNLPKIKARAAEFAARAKIKASAEDQALDVNENKASSVWDMIQYYNQCEVPPKTDETHIARMTLLRNRTIMAMFYSTGGRISEMASLNRNEDYTSRRIWLYGKGGKRRRVWLESYVNRIVRAYLDERTDNDVALFVSHSISYHGKRLSVRSIRNVVKKAAAAVGMPQLVPHDIRHYLGTDLLNEGTRLVTIQEFLGHADIGTTRKTYAPTIAFKVMNAELKAVRKNPFTDPPTQEEV